MKNVLKQRVHTDSSPLTEVVNISFDFYSFGFLGFTIYFRARFFPAASSSTPGSVPRRARQEPRDTRSRVPAARLLVAGMLLTGAYMS